MQRSIKDGFITFLRNSSNGGEGKPKNTLRTQQPTQEVTITPDQINVVQAQQNAQRHRSHQELRSHPSLPLIDPVSESTDRAELVTRPRFSLDNHRSLAAPCPMNQGRQQRAGIPLPKKQKRVAALDRTDQFLWRFISNFAGQIQPFALLLKTTEDEEFV
ncbi:hypothetical protein ACOSP7_024024 [Xanthoceras sorbifolium]